MLSRWRQQAGGGSDQRFARRLAWDGLDTRTPREVAPPQTARPPWLEYVWEALESPPAPRPAGEQVAFEEVYLLFLTVLLRRSPAPEGLQRALLKRLHWAASRALLTEMLAERVVMPPSTTFPKFGG